MIRHNQGRVPSSSYSDIYSSLASTELLASMFDTFVQKKYGPTVLFLVSDFTFVMMDGLAQKLQHRGMSTSQVMLLRFVSDWAVCITCLPC